MNMNTKYLGIVIVIFGILVLLLVNSFSGLIDTMNTGECGCGTGDVCSQIPVVTQFYIGYTLVAALVIVGIVLLVFGKKPVTEGGKEKWGKNLKKLNKDEKTVYETIIGSDGVMFQSELVEKTEMNKAKVSRILDKMEARGLLERKRRGMANAIVLK
jgi:uncharacterized membrane protein